MDKNKVYIGIYKSNNQESLFYKKDINTYYDLKQKKDVFYIEIQQDSLIPYNDIIECKSKSKRGIIKLYDLDRIQKISLNRVYIGNSYQITRVIDRKHFGTTFFDSESITEVEHRLLKKDILLISSFEYLDYADFTDIENGNFYRHLLYPQIGNVYINYEKLKPASLELGINKLEIEKGKLLAKYREYKRR